MTNFIVTIFIVVKIYCSHQLAVKVTKGKTTVVKVGVINHNQAQLKLLPAAEQPNLNIYRQ